ncbi:MAG: fibrillarin-like rRNA/tRNA 2'-O-methyltransferase [Thermoplasmata archaeon]
MRPSIYFNVFEQNGNFYTRNIIKGDSFGEKLIRIGGQEYRHWDPYRSKLAAAMKKGLKNFPFKEESVILYLGASFGNTVSFISDVCSRGKIFAVEISYKPFSSLLKIATLRKNIFPIMNDAAMPEKFAHLVEKPEIIYQDIAQKNQVDIFIKNLRFFNPKYAFLSLKTRAIDTVSSPEKVLHMEKEKLENVIETIKLDPYAIDHYMLVVIK